MSFSIDVDVDLNHYDPKMLYKTARVLEGLGEFSQGISIISLFITQIITIYCRNNHHNHYYYNYYNYHYHYYNFS